MDLSRNFLSCVDLSLIAAALDDNKSLEKLLFDKNSLSGSGLKLLSQMLLKKRTCSLNHLSLSHNALCGSRDLNSFNPENVIALANSLSDNENRSLQYLDLNFCDIGARSTKKIMESLKYNDRLQVLDISNCNITELGGISIGNALPSIKYLKVLQIKNNSIGPIGSKVKQS